MEDLPEIIRKLKLPVFVRTDAYLQDHAFHGQAVLPAVETMQLLAASTKECLPHGDVSLITNARFDKFLPIAPIDRERWIEVYHDLEIHQDGTVGSRLMIRGRSPKTAITRLVTHAALQFGGEREDDSPLPIDLVSALEGICVAVPPDRLYQELVPFGPAFHNAAAPLFVSENGAIGNLHGGATDDPSGPLGSPFPLDAAFHLASVWVQRYHGIVGFPVGFDRRLIYSATKPGESYVCTVLPAQRDGALPRLDIMITDQQGNPREHLTGLEMKDVNGGRIKPPEWISHEAQRRSLETIRNQCTALSLIELNTVNNLAEKALSDDEAHRLKKLSPKRKTSYLAARLCCKRISRQLSGDLKRPASAISTVAPHGGCPCCPVTEGHESPFCSVSHDSRFAVAVASNYPIGIDVEAISERVQRSREIYMKKEERELVDGSPLGPDEASIRIWSAKEAAAKALGMNLAESWEAVSVKDIGQKQSVLEISGRPHEAFHEAIDGHVFTVITTKSS